MQVTSDGGYVITGYTYSFGAGSMDAYVLRTDAYGSEIWWQTFGGPERDRGDSVQETQDGGYIVTGYTESSGAGGFDLWLIKLDANGAAVWSRTFGDIGNQHGRYITETSDGGFIVTGSNSPQGATGPYLWLLKTDPEGNEIWDHLWGVGDFDYASEGGCVQQTLDGGYIATGFTTPIDRDQYDLILLKTDADGNEEWLQTFGEMHVSEAGNSVQQTADGGYIAAGNKNSYDSQAWLVKTDVDGSLMWSRTYGSTGGESFNSVFQTTAGDYVLCGGTDSFGAGGSDIWLMRTDSAGIEIWSQTYGGPYADNGYTVHPTEDGGYIISGVVVDVYANGKEVGLLRLASDDPELNISLVPINSPVEIQPNGSLFRFRALVQNPTQETANFDAWTELDLTNGNTFGPIMIRHNLYLPAGGEINVTLTQIVPAFLLSGTYTFRGCVGNYPGLILDSSEFDFTKLSPGSPEDDH